MPKKHICHICSHAAFTEFPQSIDVIGVTSDFKPWNGAGLITVCRNCGHIQKHTDQKWQEDVAKIYSAYDIYHLSKGKEQVVFDFNSSFISPRSLKILEILERKINLPKRGRLLDVGCGNGELLRTFSEKFPAWLLAGYEQDKGYKNDISRIPNIEKFYSGRIENIKGEYDIITLINVLEHVQQPSKLLKNLRKNLRQEGILLIHVPDCQKNPFDFVVLDHCSHFIQQQLVQLAQNSGFEIITAASNWIPRFTSILLKPSHLAKQTDFCDTDLDENLGIVKTGLRWLQQTANHAKKISFKKKLCIFGTAIAGTWLSSVIGSALQFFVDEDPNRIGKIHLSKKIVHPTEVPKDYFVYLAFPVDMAKRIRDRLKMSCPDLSLIVPPSA